MCNSRHKYIGWKIAHSILICIYLHQFMCNLSNHENIPLHSSKTFIISTLTHLKNKKKQYCFGNTFYWTLKEIPDYQLQITVITPCRPSISTVLNITIFIRCAPGKERPSFIFELLCDPCPHKGPFTIRIFLLYNSWKWDRWYRLRKWVPT